MIVRALHLRARIACCSSRTSRIGSASTPRRPAARAQPRASRARSRLRTSPSTTIALSISRASGRRCAGRNHGRDVRRRLGLLFRGGVAWQAPPGSTPSILETYSRHRTVAHAGGQYATRVLLVSFHAAETASGAGAASDAAVVDANLIDVLRTRALSQIARARSRGSVRSEPNAGVTAAAGAWPSTMRHQLPSVLSPFMGSASPVFAAADEEAASAAPRRRRWWRPRACAERRASSSLPAARWAEILEARRRRSRRIGSSRSPPSRNVRAGRRRVVLGGSFRPESTPFSTPAEEASGSESTPF